MLLDELMPRYDVVERHAIVVGAPSEVVYGSIRRADLAGSPIARVLLTVRWMPAAVLAFLRSPGAALAELRRRRTRRREHPGVRLADFERAGFRVIAEQPPNEIVIGLLGRFWTPRGALCADVGTESFRVGPPMGQALAGWNFTVSARPDGRCDLRTETRVWCAPDARRKFRLYWFFVRPGSGLIRRTMLRAIKRSAEDVGRSGDVARSGMGR